jgi:hypothetical protein
LAASWLAGQGEWLPDVAADVPVWPVPLLAAELCLTAPEVIMDAPGALAVAGVREDPVTGFCPGFAGAEAETPPVA